ncbi:MAG: polysaccharide biosynthesis/export family protein [Acidobacteriaceae bacterium]|jgi:polysaccharide export outer membrane protein|nr:polysaccharide biosynthesis/export family protein [Acidobacteriaceae bacterium]
MKKLAILALVLWSSVASAQTDYTIGAQDVLTITVFGEPELSGKFTVEQDGTFTYPQLGRIKATGATLRTLTQEIVTQLADGYLKNPQVSVTIETYRSQRILVLGEVRSPGEYQLTSETTLLAALVRAGSTTPSAGHEVLVVRPRKDTSAAAAQEDATDVMHINLQDLQAGNLSLNVQLQDGDTINVPKAQSVFVSGQVKAPGAYAIDPGTTVLQLLSLAGGITDRGSDSRIRIQRTVNGKQTEINAKLTDTVLPGDTIIVRERFF